jgi:hypothetical protein
MLNCEGPHDEPIVLFQIFASRQGDAAEQSDKFLACWYVLLRFHAIRQSGVACVCSRNHADPKGKAVMGEEEFTTIRHTEG